MASKQRDNSKSPDRHQPEPSGSAGHSGSSGQSHNLDEMFQRYASFGDRDCQGTITLKNIDKWWEQSKLFDKNITHADTAIYFSKVAKNKKRIGLAEFKEFVDTVARYKKVEASTILSKLQAADAPRLSHTTKPIRNSAAADNMERLTDTSKYTGTHKQRFDEDGQGRGLAGRENLVSNDGYVRGYKNKDTYEKDDDEDDKKHKK